MRKILPILLALIGLGAGIGGGIMLRPDPQLVIDPCGDGTAVHTAAKPKEEEEPSTFEYVKINNQFVIPDIEDGRVVSMVVLSLSLEVEEGTREDIYAREPKLRDGLLQVLFDHANLGGFKGTFTDSTKMNALENALREQAQRIIGPQIHDVFVGDIVRQDM